MLEARFVDLLFRLASSSAPLDGIAAWVDAHPDAFRHDGGASFQLRTNVQAALAVCWTVRLEEMSDEAARKRLRVIAERAASAAPSVPRPVPTPRAQVTNYRALANG